MLPFNVTEGTRLALGRQFANLAAESVRNITGAEVQAANLIIQVEEDGARKSTFLNMGSALADYRFLSSLFEQAGAEKVMHGLLSQTEIGFKLHLQFHAKDNEEPIYDELHEFETQGLFDEFKKLIRTLAEQAEAALPEPSLAGTDFGTTNPEAFISFMDGYDGLQYIQQTEGAVTKDFQPGLAMESLIKAHEMDRTFQAPFDAAIQLGRACARFRIGSFQETEEALRKLAEGVPKDYRPEAALGEIYQSIGDAANAVEHYEAALSAHQKLSHELNPAEIQERAALHSRLGAAQMAMGMPVNAERNFRKAAELEEPEKPSLDLLAGVLGQTERAHEVPILWKQEIDRNPQNGLARARYASALHHLGKKEEAVEAFEKALSELEEPILVKRFFAPLLAESGELDRAMDFYEDCIDVAPNDIPLLIEYANTLRAADREFEVPQVLQTILASNPDPNIRAQAQAWLIEIEQPKRVDSVEEANKAVESGEAEAALHILKPLRNWLADYWKLWALLATVYNRLGMHEEAEDASKRLIALFPAYEPGYGELVNALGSLGKNEEAYNAMRHAAMSMPGSLGVHINLALAAKRAGHEDEARNLAQQIRQAVGENKELEPVLAEIET